MFDIIFIGWFLFISFLGKEKDRPAYFFILILFLTYQIVDILTVKAGINYQSSIFLSLNFDFAVAFILCEFFKTRASLWQSIIVAFAVLVHGVHIFDIIAYTNYVYDNYEIYLTIIAVLQMAHSYDSFINAVSRASERILLLLYGFNIHAYNVIQTPSEDKKGAFKSCETLQRKL